MEMYIRVDTQTYVYEYTNSMLVLMLIHTRTVTYVYANAHAYINIKKYIQIINIHLLVNSPRCFCTAQTIQYIVSFNSNLFFWVTYKQEIKIV